MNWLSVEVLIGAAQVRVGVEESEPKSESNVRLKF